MSEQEQEAAETERPANVDANGEVIEPDDGDGEPDELPTPEEEEEDEDGIPTLNERMEEAVAAEAAQEEARSLEQQQREQDAKNKRLVALAKRTADKYVEILGNDLDGFVGCPLCAPWFPGIRLPVMPDYETVAAVKVAIGEDPDPPLTNDHYSKECEACAGLGKVLTGSHVTGQQTAQCIPCKGRGWVAIGPEREAGTITAGNLMPESYAIPAPPTNGDTPPEAEALRALGYIVVPPVNTPESIAAQSGQ